MNPWLALKTEHKKETKAVQALINAGYETFMPMWPTGGAVSSKTKRKRVTYSPLIPATVFAYVRSKPEQVFRVKGVKGCLRNASGEALGASDREMVQFRACLEIRTESLISEGKDKAGPTKIKANLADREAMAGVLRVLFGMEITE